MDILGIKKLTSKVESLSGELVKMSEEKLEIEQKHLQEVQVLKAARQNLFNSFNNFNTQIFPHYATVKNMVAYQTLDDLYSVVSRIATAAALIPFYGENEDESELKPGDKLNDFIKTLTVEQKITAYTYLLLEGECFAYKEKLDFGVNAGLQKLRFLHPANVVVFISQGFPTEIIGYKYWDGLHGITVDISVEDMMFVKLFNPDMDLNQQIRGLAPVRVLMQRLTRVKSAMDTSVAQIQNGGVPGIVFDKAPNLTTTFVNGAEVGALGQRRDAFGRFLNNSSNKGAPYFAAGDMDYISIGSSLADMDLAALAEIDLNKICNVYHVSSTEFNNKSASTESNVKNHSAAFYSNGVLPLVCILKEGLNLQVLPDIKTKAVLCEDISGVMALQPDMKLVADGLAAMPVMKPNDVLEELNWPKSSDPLMDKYYIKNGYMPIEDMENTVQDIPNTANDYNATVNNAAKLLSMKTA